VKERAMERIILMRIDQDTTEQLLQVFSHLFPECEVDIVTDRFTLETDSLLLQDSGMV
jgi:hypothetical protein